PARWRAFHRAENGWQEHRHQRRCGVEQSGFQPDAQPGCLGLADRAQPHRGQGGDVRRSRAGQPLPVDCAANAARACRARSQEAMSLAASLESLRKVDLADLDINNLGSWPAPVRVITGILLLILVLFLGYHFHLKDMQSLLAQREAEEVTLKQQFTTKAFQAANLEAYQAQMVEMEESFGAMLRQLPSDTEVPGLLEDITRTGLGSGLEF